MKITKTFLVICIVSILLILNSCMNKKDKVKISDLNQAIQTMNVSQLNQLLDHDSSVKLVNEDLILKAYETGDRRLVTSLLSHSSIDPDSIIVNTSVKYYGAKASFSNIPLRFALYFTNENIPYSVHKWFFQYLYYPNELVIEKVNIMNQNAFKNPKDQYTINVEYKAKTKSGETVKRTLQFILDDTNYQIIKTKLVSLTITEDIENKVWNINRTQ